LPATGAVIGLFGQLLPHKGVFEFVRAATLAARDAADATFVLAGPAPEGLVERLRREAAATPGERIRVLPPLPSTASLYAAADAICLASTSPDPLPRAVLEAMAAGLPVVAFRSGGTEEMVQEGETGLLFDVGDVEGLAAGFRRLIADPALRGSMGRAARRRAESEFTVDRHVQRMESLLEEIARR
jgi:glycosyltransferase involved in cell wall biosynthesis